MSRTRLMLAVAFSLAVHLAGAAIFIEPPDTVEIADGAMTSELVIGTAFDDSLMAGEPGEALQPVDVVAETQPAETTAVETTVVEPADALMDAQTVATSIEPVAAENLQPTEVTFDKTPSLSSDPITANEVASPPHPSNAVPLLVSQASDKLGWSPSVETGPVHTEELASLPSVSKIVPAAEPDLALPENLPVPVPRPEPPETRTAQAKPPAHARQKATKPTNQKPKPVKLETKRGSAQSSKAGDDGKQAATASRSSSGAVSAKRTAVGNAAVSNYPGKVASKLRRSLRYPRAAMQQRIRGDVFVSFVVKANGGVSNIRIAKSSGFPVLDEAAKEAVRRAAPFPSIPADAGRNTWSFSVPLSFTR